MIVARAAIAWVIIAVSAAVSSSAPSAHLQSAQPSPPRILVLPFENAGAESRVSWLSEAAAVLLADGLKARGLAAITREERVRTFEELHLPLSATLSRATIIKVAQVLGARQLITGSFRVQDRTLVVEAQMIRIDAGRARAPVVERGELVDLFGMHERLVGRLVEDGRAAAATGPRPPLGAFENYIKGLIAASPAAKATFLESALQDFPAFDRARLSLWDVRTDQGDHGAALAAAKAVPEGSPLASRARFLAATSLLSLERYDEAFASYNELAGMAPAPEGGAVADRGALYNNLGVVQIRRGATPQSGTATYFLTKATEADAAETDYLFNLGYAYALERNFQAAIYWLREALRRDPADAEAHVVLAAALQATGSVVEAGRERELARQLSARYEELAPAVPGSDRLPVRRGLERIQPDPDGSGRLRTDLVVGSSVQRDQREQATFHLERARRLSDREQDGEALSELRRAVYLSPYQAEAHLLIGRIHLRAGRPQEAIDALKISVWSADTAAARLVLADAYVKTGETNAARGEAERALALDPASTEAKRLLAEIR